MLGQHAPRIADYTPIHMKPATWGKSRAQRGTLGRGCFRSSRFTLSCCPQTPRPKAHSYVLDHSAQAAGQGQGHGPTQHTCSRPWVCCPHEHDHPNRQRHMTVPFTCKQPRVPTPPGKTAILENVPFASQELLSLHSFKIRTAFHGRKTVFP